MHLKSVIWVSRCKQVAPSSRPRALVDDVTVHWVHQKLDRCVELRRATTQYVQEMQDLKMIAQPAKSVATRASTVKAFESHGKGLGLTPKRWVTNFGHDLHET